MSTGDLYENRYLDAGLGSGRASNMPATLYLVLFSTATTDAGGGTEITGGGMARVAIANTSTNFGAASGGSKTNAVAIEFPALTANLPTATHFALADAATGTNWMHHGPLASPKPLFAGETPRVKAGQLVITAS